MFDLIAAVVWGAIVFVLLKLKFMKRDEN